MESAKLQQLRPLKKSVFSISLLAFILCTCYPAGSNASYRYSTRLSTNDIDDDHHQHGLIVGKINNGTDILLYHDTIQSNGRWHFAKEDLYYPPEFTRDRARINITMINVTDLMPQGEWGQVTLRDGGVGHRKVRFRLEGRSGYRYFFNIDIWGHFV